MLLTLAVVAVLLLSLIGFAAVAWVARAAMERLGLDPWKVLLWFGLAEAPVDELAVRRGAPARTSVRAAPSASR